MFDFLFEKVPDGNERFFDWILSGLDWTLALAASAWLFAFSIGTVIGCARTSDNKIIGTLARLYVEVFRNIPVIVQMFFWYFVLPEILAIKAGNALKHMSPPWASFMPAVVGLSLYTAARVAEQVKAGIESLPKGQVEGATALGLRSLLVYRLVLLPQALRIILPTLTSEVMGAFKNTSVALTIGLLELTAQARQINEYTFQTFQAFGVVTLVYLALALVVYAAMFSIEAYVKIPGIVPASRTNPSISKSQLMNG